MQHSISGRWLNHSSDASPRIELQLTSADVWACVVAVWMPEGMQAPGPDCHFTIGSWFPLSPCSAMSHVKPHSTLGPSCRVSRRHRRSTRFSGVRRAQGGWGCDLAGSRWAHRHHDHHHAGSDERDQVEEVGWHRDRRRCAARSTAARSAASPLNQRSRSINGIAVMRWRHLIHRPRPQRSHG